MYPEIIEFSEEIPAKVSVQRIEEYPYHWHNAVEIILLLDGRAEVTLCGETHLLKKGGVAVVNVNEPHRIKKSGGENRLLLLQIDPAFCRSVDPEFDDVIFFCCSTYHEAEVPEKYRRMKESITHLALLLDEDGSPVQEADVRAGLNELLNHMIQGFDYLHYGAGTQPIPEKLVQRYRMIYEYLRQTPGAKNPLSELAKAAGVSPQHLSGDISEKFGLTLRELIYSGNCMEAVRLLLSTDKMIYEISPASGFSDPKYLIKAFKQFYGCTPSEFRKRHKVGPEGLAAQTRYEDFPTVLRKEVYKYFSGPEKCQCEG
jgi:AraC-like DNA-binding protein